MAAIPFKAERARHAGAEIAADAGRQAAVATARRCPGRPRVAPMRSARCRLFPAIQSALCSGHLVRAGTARLGGEPMTEAAAPAIDGETPVNPYSLLEAVNRASRSASVAWLLLLG